MYDQLDYRPLLQCPVGPIRWLILDRSLGT